MKYTHLLGAVLFCSYFVVSPVFAGDTYQVTGAVLSVTDNAIVVQKGDEKWEVAKDAATQVKGGEIKAGTKVTIKYRMTAVTVEVKDAKK